ncbi:LysR substrate-binding domain-containing protein [Streptomyces sp. st140]|uniref:LysR substrate-binding domain-containing protein n=1 Tax=Streptomyces sp. st140 TaxID=1828052 RepID=UPI00211D846C|nr:LysR substrate-binding domain-containing protein [Streptomyces sp. st140]
MRFTYGKGLRVSTPTTAGVQALARARIMLAGTEELVREATTGHTRLHIGHAWSAFGRHTTEFQRRWHEQHPETELRLIRHNTPTGGLAEGLCDLAVIRAPIDLTPWSHARIGDEARYVAMASDDPWARRRSIRLDEIPRRTLAIDRRTGTTALGLWPEADRPAVEFTHDIDDWLAAIATGRCDSVYRSHAHRRPRPSGPLLRAAGPRPRLRLHPDHRPNRRDRARLNVARHPAAGPPLSPSGSGPEPQSGCASR